MEPNNVNILSGPDRESLVRCPFDDTHLVRHSRYPYHVSKCRRQYRDEDVAVCPFNAKHVMMLNEFPFHKAKCPNRFSIEQDAVVSPRIDDSYANPCRFSDEVPTKEDWDAEGTSGNFQLNVFPSQLPSSAVARTLGVSRPKISAAMPRPGVASSQPGVVRPQFGAAPRPSASMFPPMIPTLPLSPEPEPASQFTAPVLASSSESQGLSTDEGIDCPQGKLTWGEELRLQRIKKQVPQNQPERIPPVPFPAPAKAVGVDRRMVFDTRVHAGGLASVNNPIVGRIRKSPSVASVKTTSASPDTSIWTDEDTSFDFFSRASTLSTISDVTTEGSVRW